MSIKTILSLGAALTVLLANQTVGYSQDSNSYFLLVVGGHILTANRKPVPNAIVTTPFATAPAVSDSGGAYFIAIRMPPGNLPVKFHVEHRDFEPQDKLVAVAQSINVDFILRRRHQRTAKAGYPVKTQKTTLSIHTKPGWRTHEQALSW